MKYYLVIYNGKYQPITGFSKIPAFSRLNETALADIIKFTNHFEDSNDLKNYLIVNNLWPNASLEGEFRILAARSKTNYHFLDYGISYKKDASLFNVDDLTQFYVKHLDDVKFMDAFLYRYYLRLKKVPIVGENLHIINEKHADYKKTGNILMSEKTAMETFIKYYTTKKNKEGIRIENYLTLRELAMFAINYKRKNEKQDSTLENINMANIYSAIEHYRQMLDNMDFEEGKEYYEQEISNLEGILEELATAQERRRFK